MRDITYRVIVGFAGFIGAEEEIDIDAPVDAGENTLESIIQNDPTLVMELLEIDEDEVVSLGDNEWEVPVTFAGFLGTETLYNVYAETLDEAIELAYEEASADITIEDYESLEDDYDDSDEGDIHSEEWYIARDHGEDTDPYM